MKAVIAEQYGGVEVLEITDDLPIPRVGPNGVLVEVHPEPEKALSDGPQSLTFQGFEQLMAEVRRLSEFLGFA